MATDAEATRQIATIQEETTMYQSARSLQQSWSARQSETLNIVATYGRLSPAVFAARERLAESLAHQAVASNVVPRVAPRPIRRWLGGRLVRLGTRLGGAGVPKSTTLAPGKVAA
jgi:hypothetical protein